MAFLLWHYLADSAVLHPRRPAVAWGDAVLSYRDLDHESSRLASVLVDRGIGPGSTVGLLMPKSPRSVVAMLGISKTGAAYVPVDPNSPGRRAALILGDCGIRALITTDRKLSQLGEHLGSIPSLETALLAAGQIGGQPQGHLEVVPWTRLAEVDADPPVRSVAIEDDPAYLLYTSGSTGVPKGVTISHRNAMAFVEWGAETFRVGPTDRLSNHAPLHFDLSVFDIYVALRSGACVVMVPDEIAPFPRRLAEWIDRQRITVWYSVPSAFTRLLLHGGLDRFSYDDLRIVLYAGERFPVAYLREVMARLSRADFYNLYGPTETNVCTYHHVPHDLADDVTDIPIGIACGNTAVFGIDDEGRLIGAGDEGELYVRGPTVMLGYWKQPGKTTLAVIPNPFQPGFEERVYRTGDLVRVDRDGCYTFIGRRDHMVKSRGYRIELGEIEEVLHRNDGVEEAVVLPIPDDEIGCRLHAIVVPHAGGGLTEHQLQAYCMDHLPRYMVPESFVVQGEPLARTSTGKVNRMALMQSLGQRSDAQETTP